MKGDSRFHEEISSNNCIGESNSYIDNIDDNTCTLLEFNQLQKKARKGDPRFNKEGDIMPYEISTNTSSDTNDNNNESSNMDFNPENLVDAILNKNRICTFMSEFGTEFMENIGPISAQVLQQFTS
ncbi:3416_t:CDS:2 [Scutellospora calospora]|uniref:3416_t:CDS:1 n=1 Tax=Scutellospora calospora TaxID=85575 RepID=A0ACA9KUI6_9GLOM|nr:3416_t:CDS:2 [Scutellospora calospora]